MLEQSETKSYKELKEENILAGYQRFENDFFAWRTPFGFAKKDEKEKITECTERYFAVLHNEQIRDILTGNLPPFELSRKSIDELLQLTTYEQNPSSMIVRTSRRGLDREGLLRELNVTMDEAVATHAHGPIEAHLWRLAAPEKYSEGLAENEMLRGKVQNSVCKNFARAYVEYGALVADKIKEALQRTTEIIGGEGGEVQCFWTLAPYLYDELQRTGYSSREAMEKVLKWTEEGNSFWDFGIYGSESDNYVLGYDERMPSHLLARLLAKQVASRLSADKSLDESLNEDLNDNKNTH